ncbi:MAG: hypothetical protein NTX50_14020 [Candidatus Sumerlaeota bacterium]|nr:hypothetical protein [Candidatus Sumerlaeota bacterium]
MCKLKESFAALLVISALILYSAGWLSVCAEPTTHSLLCQVLMPDGKPATGATAYLMGTMRPNRQGWVSVLKDQEGDRIWVRYHIIILAGEKHSAYISPDSFPRDLSSCTIQLTSGGAIEGIVCDMENLPISSASIQIDYSVPFDSHTGFGGELWATTGATGADGRYRIERVCQSFIDGITFKKNGYHWLMTQTAPKGEWLMRKADPTLSPEIKKYWYSAKMLPDDRAKIFGRVSYEDDYWVEPVIWIHESTTYNGINSFLEIRPARDGGAYEHKGFILPGTFIQVSAPGFENAYLNDQRYHEGFYPGRCDFHLKRSPLFEEK